MIKTTNNNFIIFRARESNGWKSIFLPNLQDNSEFVCNTENQTIGGVKTFSSNVICNQTPTQNSHLTRKDYVDSQISNAGNFLKKDGSNFMTGDLNMNEQKIKNMLDPVNEQDGVNKRFLEAKLHDYLKTDGQNPMTFDLNMNNHKIKNLKNFDSSSDTTDTDVPNIKYIKDNYVNRSLGILQGNLNANNNKIINLTLPTNIEDAVNKQYTDDNFLKLDGSTPLAGDLNIGTHKITDLALPVATTDATNKAYVDATHLGASSYQSNPFKYLMNDVDESSRENNIVVINISHFTGSPHSINKNAYLLTLIKDGDGSNQYRSRIGFDIFSLSLGFYTLVVEFFPPDMQNVSVHASSTTASIKKQASKTFPAVGSTAGYVKTLIQFHRWQTSFNIKYIYLDLHGVATSSTTGRIVVYRVSGLVSNVPSSVFDQVCVMDNGRMVMQTDLDLHGHQIKNNNQGGLSFDSGGVISLHDDLNTE